MNEGYRSGGGAIETLGEVFRDIVAPAHSVRILAPALLAAFTLFGAACGKAPNLEGYSPLPAESASLESPETVATPVEFYFYINSDNDILGIRENGPEAGRAENQGELLFESLLRDTGLLPAGVGVHVYLDRGAEIRKGDEVSSETFSHCSGSAVAWPAEKLGETDSRDPIHLRRLLARSCAKDSKKFVILWSHGEGFRVQKDFDYHPGITTSAIGPAFHISRLITAIPDGFAEAVLFDSCSMASLEIATLVAPKARYLLSSQFLLPNDGLQYAGAWKLLAKNRETRTLLREIRMESETRFREIGIMAPLVIVELEKLPELEIAFRSAMEAGLPKDSTQYAEFRESVLRGEKDGDVLFLLQKHGTRNALAAALDQGRGSLHFALPSAWPETTSIDSDLENVAMADPELFRTWSEKFPNWALHRNVQAHEVSVPSPAQPVPSVSKDTDTEKGALL